VREEAGGGDPVGDAAALPSGSTGLERHRASLSDLFRTFLKISLLGVGGPSAHLALMLDEVVERRGWIDREHFLHLIGVTNLLPGPNSSQVAIHVGHTQRGVPGALVTGLAFLTPTFLMVTGLSVVYFRYGTVPAVAPVLWGLKPVIAAIILMAGWRLGMVAMRGRAGPLLGAVGLLVAVVAGRWIVVSMAVGGLVTWSLWRASSGGPGSRSPGAGVPGNGAPSARGDQGPRHDPSARGGQARTDTPGEHPDAPSPALLLVPLPGAALAASAAALGKVFFLHLGIGAVLFGGGYTLVALLEPHAVAGSGWLTPGEYLDGIALSQAVPGPISTLSAFVGYAAAGLPGAVLATTGVYLPAFVAVLLAARHVERLRGAEWARAALDGVNAVVTGSIFGVGLSLLPAAVDGAWAVLLFVAAMLAMARFRVPAAAVVLVGLGAGVARAVLS
jgi:chromate transporter